MIAKFEKDIEHKREVFRRIQPATDEYLSKLGDSYLSEFVPNKANIDQKVQYNEQTVNKYLSNVQDYYKLIQTWDEANKGAQGEENKDIEKLREEMKMKLGGLEKNKIINKKLLTSMRSDLKNEILKTYNENMNKKKSIKTNIIKFIRR